jgi:hypothetical protein
MAALPVQAFKNVHIKALHLLPDFPKGDAKVEFFRDMIKNNHSPNILL